MIKRLFKTTIGRVFLCTILSLSCAQIVPSMMASHNGLSFQAQWQSDPESCILLTLLFGAVFFIASLRLLDVD